MIIKIKLKKIIKFFLSKLPNRFKTYLLIKFYRPKNFIVEPINICNIRCAACPWHTIMKREKRALSFSDFIIIFNKIKKYAENITFYQMGEPLLNKDLFKMIKLCEENDISTNIATNGMLIKESLEDIFNSNLSTIKIALDGIIKETHEKYRLGSDFDKIINNIKLLKISRDNKLLKKPIITIQTLANKYNQNQLKDIKKFSNKYADSFVYKKMHLGRDNNTRNKNKHFETDIEKFKRIDVKNKKLYYKNMDFCPQFDSMVILSNGEVVQCCFDYEGDTSFGNILKDDYLNILQSKKRTVFLKSYFDRCNNLCNRCDFISNMLRYD